MSLRSNAVPESAVRDESDPHEDCEEAPCVECRTAEAATPDLGDDPDGDLDEIEAIAAARAAGHGYQPARFDDCGYCGADSSHAQAGECTWCGADRRA